MTGHDEEATDRLSFMFVHAAAACPAQALELLQIFIQLSEADRKAVIAHARRFRPIAHNN